ncbi:MAG TPA: CAP domain-containing protein [Thermoanaerobaculia bacterium]|jgi:uncharacterized protein YkwD
MKRILFLLLLCVPLFASDANNEITPENVLGLMNAYRAESNLPPLRADETLMLAAADRMHDMEDLGYWSHESPDGRSPFTVLVTRHYPYRYAGENLASGFETARLLVSSWMESPGHRANIMGAEYDECGIAVIEGATTGRATGKSVVVLFGRRR